MNINGDESRTRSKPAKSSRILIVLTVAVVGLLLVGFYSGSAKTAGIIQLSPTHEPLMLTIRLHSCPDDLQATGFYQYQQRCTSEAGLYGVPLTFTQGDSEPHTIYSQPDGTGGAAPISPNFLNFSQALTISEPTAFLTRDSVVFCSQNLSKPSGPLLDGTQMDWQSGSLTLDEEVIGTVLCDWYRFPGGVTAEPVTGDPASPNTYHQITIRTYVCPLGEEYVTPNVSVDAQGNVTLPNPAPDAIDLQSVLGVFQAKCTDATTPFAFHLTGSDGVDQPLGIGGQAPLYFGWSNLAAGTYAIREELPAGFTTPVVLCESLVRGADGKDVKTPVIPVVSNGQVNHDLGEFASMSCDWFNFSGAVAGDDQAPANNVAVAEDDRPVVGGAVDPGLDSDSDGITDVDETAMGTDPSNNDSDQDGLYDWDEPNVYFTDPLNPDSDGDGADDGLEVYNGTDPLDPASH
jgi:hypothetical protein